jgi:hypothetical protein
LNSPHFSKRVSSATVFFTATVLAILPLAAPRASAQNPQLQQKLAEIKQAAAANKQSLARYTWQEQRTIIIKGAVKKQEVFQVRLGPDGKPQRTLVSSSPPSSSAGGPLRQKIVDKKTADYEQYGQQIAALAQSYTQPDPERLQQSYQQGNVTLGSAGTPGEVQLMITGYIKPNDSVGVIFNEAQKALQSLQISTYLTAPKDAVRISAQFSKLPDGTTHVSSMTVEGVSKQLSIRVQNASYQKL